MRLNSPTALRRTALTSLFANVGIVITGGAVRLTDSGLGCPTWPRCTDSSYVPTKALGYHGVIEFGNRTLTGVVGVLAVLTVGLALLQVRRDRRQIWWAAGVLAGIPAQAVLGKFVVVSHLNPWLVGCHFLLSMAVIAAAYFCWRAACPAALAPAGQVDRLAAPLRALSIVLLATTAAVLVAGTVVTGSGPHAGDAHARRTGLDPQMVSQLHADLVMLLIGLSVAMWLALRAVRAPARLVRAAAVLVAVELAQGAIGFAQYFTHLPVLLVGCHMAGACAVWVAALAVFAGTRHRPTALAAAPADAGTARSRLGPGDDPVSATPARAAPTAADESSGDDPPVPSEVVSSRG